MDLRPSLPALAFAVAVAGCGSQSSSGAVSASDGATLYACATETRAPPYMPGMHETSASGTYVATLMASVPAPPIQGNDTWTVQIATAAGAPAGGLTIGVVPFMPDHGHGTSIQAIVTDQGSGVYQMAPLYLFMEGYWTITLNLQGGSAAPDSVMFPVCIP